VAGGTLSALLERKKQDDFTVGTDFDAKRGVLAVSVLHPPAAQQLLPKTRTGAASPLSQPRGYLLTYSGSKQAPDS